MNEDVFPIEDGNFPASHVGFRRGGVNLWYINVPAPSKGYQLNPKVDGKLTPCNGTIWHPLEGPGR